MKNKLGERAQKKKETSLRAGEKQTREGGPDVIIKRKN